MELRQSTIYESKEGPFVNSTGVTPVTNLTIDGADEAEILQSGVTATGAISGTLTAIAGCDGHYILTLSASETGVLGPLKVVIQDDSLCLPYTANHSVVTQNYYDSKYSTESFKVSLTSAIYTAIADFKATGFSTFDPASSGVTLSSAVYTAITDFRATGFSTFDPASSGVTLSSAVYGSIGAFRTTLTSLNDISVADIIAGVSDGAYDLNDMMRLMVAALCGKGSGGSTTAITFRDLGDTRNRIVATVDDKGNRTAMGYSTT